MRFLAALIFSALLAAASQGLLAATSTADLRAPDGVGLKATYYAPDVAGPGVLLLPMCSSDRSSWRGLGELLAQRGIHALALDYRGSGESGGRRDLDREAARQARADLWPRDVDVAFEYLRSRPEVDAGRIGAVGASCGVDQAVQLARRHPGEVQVLAFLAGGAGPAGQAFLGANTWLPILAVASRQDGRAVETTRWTMEFSGNSANLFLAYDRGGHGTELFAVHQDLPGTIADWFAKHLVEKPVVRPPSFRARPGPSARLASKVFRPGGGAEYRQLLKAARGDGGELALPPEGAIDGEAHRLLEAGQLQEAMELFHLNVEAFPGSARALDGLGDVYRAAGQPRKATKFTRKALATIPGDRTLDRASAEELRRSAEAKLQAPQ